jgi:putative transposase
VRALFPGEVWQPSFHEHRVRDGQDFANQMAYIEANPEHRNLANYPFVHTRFADRIDPMPPGL